MPTDPIVIGPRSATLVTVPPRTGGTVVTAPEVIPVPSRGPQGIPGKGLIVLDAGEPVPADTPSGTVIFRRDP